MSIDLTTLSAREVLSAVYIGYYNRAADAAGMQFWEQVIANTSLDLEAIATDFAGQSETQAVHPFFADPATSTPSTFITSLYQNLFNRDADPAGLAFWSEQLQNAIDGVEGSFSVGEIIVKIIEGAVDTPATDDAEATLDRTTILNKIEVAQDWTDAAEANGGEFNAAAMVSAKEVIADVTSEASTVVDAKAATDAFFEATTPTNPGDTFFLESKTDVMTGTENDDQFNAYIQQNPFAGGVSNSLSSADRLEGGAGNDRLYAEVTGEFVGVVGNVSNIDIQPRLSGIEEIDIEARESTFLTTEFLTGGPVVVDAKNITDHVEIGSYFSDGDLKIENLTTLTAGGAARNTSDITVTMDHTDNFNSDRDASDLEVLFDNDYLLSGQESEGQVFYHLLDEDAELAGLTDRLDNIDVDGIRFNITNADGSVTDVTIEDPAAQTAGTHQGFVNALQDALQALIADGTLPAGTTLTLDPTNIDRTFLDDGTESADIPAITLITGDGSAVEATGFSRVEEAIGEYDVYGRFGEVNEVADQPISIDIDLHKVGRGGNGGDLIVGGKAGNSFEGGISEGIAAGIEVFNIDVLGAGSEDPNGAANKPSSLGTVTSTGNALKTVMIATAAEFVAGSTHASLEIRDGFNAVGASGQSGDLELVNADGFLGNLYLGTDQAIINLDTLTAQGGGDVTFNGNLDGTETNQAFSYTTGSGSDTVNLTIDGDALDHADSSVNVFTAGGNDKVTISLGFDIENNSNNQLNQAILDNVSVDTGAGNDVIDIDGVGVANIMAGEGNDVVYTDGGSATASWAFNFDNARVDAQGLLASITTDDLPGVEPSLSYVGGATVTVTLSGAGLGNLLAGGGVMAEAALGAVAGDDGYEASSVISQLLNGNKYYGTQLDVNAAILDAINNDPILGNLLEASIAANNTLVVESLTSGAFAAIDLRVDISTADATSSTYANAVLSEAQSAFGDSDLTLTDLWGTTTFTSAAPGVYQDDTTAPGADLTNSADANTWYDGLSVAGDANSADDNQRIMGSTDGTENDNVINGGDGDDLIVLSTDAFASLPPAFTVSSNNALINGASNETIVLTGSNFGNDTVMNFTAANEELIVDLTQVTYDVRDSVTVDAASAGGTATYAILDGLLASGSLEVLLTQGDTAADVVADIINAVNNNPGSLYTAALGGDATQIELTANDPSTVAPVSFSVEDRTGTTVEATFSDTDLGEGGVGLATATVPLTLTSSGVDFLDFTAYLTSQDNLSSAPGSDSNELIEVTLDNQTAGSTSPAGSVQANEVVLVDLDSTATAGETFASISASDVAALFNTTTDDFGDLSATGFTADDSYTKTGNSPTLVGDAKGILGIENEQNDGEYKFFMLTWDGEEDGADVSVSLLGSIDFGDSLDQLSEVSLVGSQAYEDLLTNGFA